MGFTQTSWDSVVTTNQPINPTQKTMQLRRVLIIHMLWDFAQGPRDMI